ncbi:unnamed protein product [Ixodes pacificus]
MRNTKRCRRYCVCPPLNRTTTETVSMCLFPKYKQLCTTKGKTRFTFQMKSSFELTGDVTVTEIITSIRSNEYIGYKRYYIGFIPPPPPPCSAHKNYRQNGYLG